MKIALSSVLAVLAAAEWTVLVAAHAKYACPDDKGQTLVTGGKKYRLECGKGIRGLPIEDEKACDSLGECAERCAKHAQCVHSVFVGKSSKCALKKAGDAFDLADLSTWMFVEKVEDQLPPTEPATGDNSQKPLGGGDQASFTCPADEKKKYTTNAITYELRCDTGHSVGHWRDEPCPSLRECADGCARDAECYSCDWHRQNKKCFFKKAPSETAPWAVGDAWYPAPCPEVREARATKEPETASELSCPSNNGKIWEGSDGTWFYLQCCTDTGAATVVEQGTASSHKKCVEMCVATNKCKSVSYDSRAAEDNCRMYGNGGFSTTSAERVHHAFVTLPPANEVPLTTSALCSTECPHAHGQLFVGAAGENFLMSCNHRQGTRYLTHDRRESYEACMTACSVMPQCRSVDYEPRTKRCLYSTSADQPTIRAAAFRSAHALGACGSCKTGCDAARTEALADEPAMSCDDGGGQVVAGGEQSRLRCRHCWNSSQDTIRNRPEVKGLAECARLCGEDPLCHGANWMGPSGCHLHPHLDKNGEPPVMKRSAACDSITPLRRSLAGYKEEHVQDSGITDRSW